MSARAIESGDSGVEILGPLLSMLVLLLVGTGLRARGVLDATRTARLNAAAYYGALPALVFVSTYEQSIGDLLSPVLVGGLLFVLFTTAVFAWIAHRHLASAPRQSVAIVQSYHSNIGYLGLPLIAAVFDAEVTAIASIILGIVTLAQLPLTILVLIVLTSATTRIGREAKRVATNPVMLSLGAGLGVGSIGLAIPGVVASGLEFAGSLALPLALLCVGASLSIDLSGIEPRTTGAIVALKLGLMPVLTWIVLSAMNVDAATLAAGVVMLGTPTAVSTYVYASELGGDPELASVNVFVTTVLSIGTLFLLIRLVQ